MKCALLFVKIFLVHVLCIDISLTQVDDDGCYTAAFTEDAKECDGFENQDFICVLNIDLADNEDGESGMVLTGRLEVNKEITDEVEVSINVWKDIGTGPQYMYTMESNLCDCLSKNDTPFYPLVQALGTTSCPIAEGVYEVENMAMSLDFAENVMNHEFVGEYDIECGLIKGEVKVSCYTLAVAVEEKSCD